MEGRPAPRPTLALVTHADDWLGGVLVRLGLAEPTDPAVDEQLQAIEELTAIVRAQLGPTRRAA
jgi:hypothetical protein